MFQRYHTSVLLLLSLGLTACGPDLVGSAVTGTSIKKQELEQVQDAQKKAIQQLQQATEKMKQSNDQADQAAR